MINTSIHNVTSIDVGHAEQAGQTKTCPHLYAVRTIVITTQTERITIDLFAATTDDLSLPAERIPVIG